MPLFMEKAEKVITLDARAKVNLTLEILGKRPDGYHALRSVVMPVTLCDTLRFTLRTTPDTVMTTTLEPNVDGSHIGAPEKNLVVRMATLIQTRYGISAGVDIALHKRIPIGGGLGGGSADAAAVIRGLNQLWNLNLSLSEMVELGAELGSDIPALVQGGAVLMEGRGEFVTPLFSGVSREECPGTWMIIANPGVMCPTGEVFKKWSPDLTPPPLFLHNIHSSIRNSDVAALAAALFNGLQRGVFENYPAVAKAAQALHDAGCFGVLLSGSGASVFGLVRDEQHGAEVSQRLQGNLWHVLAKTCPVV